MCEIRNVGFFPLPKCVNYQNLVDRICLCQGVSEILNSYLIVKFNYVNKYSTYLRKYLLITKTHRKKKKNFISDGKQAFKLYAFLK